MRRDIYICMDDSGKLNRNEKWTVFAGVVFLSQEDRDSFIRKYHHAINDIKCDYCGYDPDECMQKCPEVKSNSPLRNDHRRRLMNLIKKEYRFACIISNDRVYDHIIADKAARGRYIDYATKMFVKRILQNLIYERVIDREDEIVLHLLFDEQPTVTNGYYNLDQSIYEELMHGIDNYQYGVSFRPILAGSLTINLKYFDSKYHYDIQACDVLAGTLRHIIIDESIPYMERIELIKSKTDTWIFLPSK